MNAPLSPLLPKTPLQLAEEYAALGLKAVVRFTTRDCANCLGSGCECCGLEGTIDETRTPYAIVLFGGDYVKERFLTLPEAWLTWERLTREGKGASLYDIEDTENEFGLSDLEREWLEEMEFWLSVEMKKAVVR